MAHGTNWYNAGCLKTGQWEYLDIRGHMEEITLMRRFTACIFH
jgi:hypothetical protein